MGLVLAAVQYQRCKYYAGGKISCCLQRKLFQATINILPPPVLVPVCSLSPPPPPPSLQEGDDTDTVHITVPQTQFEIEINSGGGEEGDSPCEGIHPIQAHNLSGPTFEVIHQEVRAT